MSKQILSLQNLWIARNNIFNCLLSFVMEKHKVQKRFITKLLEKARVTEKKNNLLGVRPGRTVLCLENKSFKKDWKERLIICHRLPFTSYAIN